MVDKNEKDNRESFGRAFCYQCFKPQISCICSDVDCVPNNTEIVILQHKCERAHPLGTVRIAMLGLQRARLEIVWPNENGKFICSPVESNKTALLYPSPNSISLSDLSPSEHPDKLIVLDGTWSDAGTLYKDNQWLQELPHYHLNPSEPSRYRIRLEPNESSISTIEAIVDALSILEPETSGIEKLIESFDSMIDKQILLMNGPNASKTPRRFKRTRNKPSRRLPEVFGNPNQRFVVGYGESTHFRDKQRTLVSFTAQRLDNGALFEQLVIPPPQATLTDDHLELMGLSRDDFKDAISPVEFAKRWRSFFCPEDVLLTWNRSNLDLFSNLYGSMPNSLFIKEGYCNTTGKKCGHLQDAVARSNLDTETLPIRGRSALRISETAAVANYLIQIALDSRNQT